MDEYTFATSPHGLGLSAEVFWGSSFLALTRHRKALERSQERTTRMLAPILAALHNGPIGRKDKAFWVPEMFMPDYRTTSVPQSDDSWKAVKARAMESKAMTMEQRKVLYEQQTEFGLRASRAAAAKANGATREQVIALMEGN